MGEKILVDKEQYENLVRYAKEDPKGALLRTASYIREALTHGIIVPNNDSTQSAEQIRKVLSWFNAVEEECSISYPEDPKYNYARIKEENTTTLKSNLRLV